jgi:hypothetical protein
MHRDIAMLRRLRHRTAMLQWHVRRGNAMLQL